MNKEILLFVFSLVLLTAVFAEEYYADLTIDIDESGITTFDGINNHPNATLGESTLYTNKNKNIWLFNYTLPDTYSNFIVSVTLPKYSTLHYVKLSGSFRLEHEGDKITIITYGQDKPLQILLQYEITEYSQSEWILWTSGFVALFFLGILLYWVSRVAKPSDSVSTQPANNHDMIIENLPERQQAILDLLKQANKPVTQKYIEQQLKLPKSSISRNIKSLELKGLIEKEELGMSNKIQLKR